MRILICNERFLFRFGLDRVLIILAQGLKKFGHEISFAVLENKFDKKIMELITSKIIEIPEKADDYINLNEFIAKYLEENWDVFFGPNQVPDIVVIGGWPFFSAISKFVDKGIPVLFSDHGAVPLDGFSGATKAVQEKLRKLRKKYLPEVSAIIAVSDYIAESQSIPDSKGEVPIYIVLNGVDHLDMNIWNDDNLKNRSDQSNSLNQIKKVKNSGKKILLALGRWEEGTYKNSKSLFKLISSVKIRYPNIILLVLTKKEDVLIPKDLEENIIPIGFPDDLKLKEIMNLVDLGISTSLWEGFNLPLGEMQWLNKPVLVFDIGAHPEVVIHPYYLCKDIDEMVNKTCEILENNDLSVNLKNASLDQFKEFFTWKRAVIEYNKIIEDILKSSSEKKDESLLIFDVTNAAHDPANSGVIRVTRRICREVQKYIPVIFVVWDKEKAEYFLPTKEEFTQLSKYNGPLFSTESKISLDERESLKDYLNTNDASKVWLILTETIYEKEGRKIRKFAKQNNLPIAAIFYDAIPVLYPNFCQDLAIKKNHPNYMIGLAECNIIIPISEYSSRCLQKFWKDHNIDGCSISSNLLPGEFSGSKRKKTLLKAKSNLISILCVSTLEPRKNHKSLINACLLMQKEHPEIDWTLNLVGNRYAGAFDIAEGIEKMSNKNPRIKWLGVVSDTKLQQLYNESTFTVYPSIVEGFGMPILESLWHGKPVICSNQGVMSELAADGGCLITNVLDEKALADTIYKLSTNEILLDKLSNEAMNRSIKTWDEYTKQFLSILGLDQKFNDKLASDEHLEKPKGEYNWEDILYPNCICENWQMNHSERMALTSLLMRHKPNCSIEVGTFKGGSLSLISQLSQFVYSLDIDPSIPEKFKQFENVTFITGSSVTSLPLLLKAFEEECFPVDFILIDGDHSAEGVKKDLNSVLGYKPLKPLFVMLHDSFNPECRKGMLEANWDESKYVRWVDLDFVPGRIVENGSDSQGEMWGGLAIAYFSPDVRKNSFKLDQTAKIMFELIGKNSEVL